MKETLSSTKSQFVHFSDATVENTQTITVNVGSF